MKIAFVLGTTAGGTGRHVQMLTAGCAARGIPSVVFGPRETQRAFAFGAGRADDGAGSGDATGSGGADAETAPDGAAARAAPDGAAAPVAPEVAAAGFSAVEFRDRPQPNRDGWAVLRLRHLIVRSGADVVHAHGLRAGALTAIALAFIPRRHRPPLVVTVHNAAPSAGVNAQIYRVLERVVARGATAVLCVSADLEARMREAGAPDVGRALVPAPAAPVTPAGETAAPEAGGPETASGEGAGPEAAAEARKELTDGAERPLVLAAGRLAEQKGFALLLEAARQWQDLDPVPLLAIAGTGPLAGPLAAQATPLGPAVRFLGQRADVPALLAAADLFVLPSRWEGQPLILQEALRAGRPIVASRVGGIPDLTGEDAALLVPAGDPDALAAAVRRVLTDDGLARRLGGAALERARALPSEDDAIEAAVAVYRRLLAAARPDGSNGPVPE